MITYASPGQLQRWLRRVRGVAAGLLNQFEADMSPPEHRGAGRGVRPWEWKDGWYPFPYPVDPLVRCFSGLGLRPGWTLRAYLYRSGGNGNGVVWAMPADAPFPPPSECAFLTDRFLAPPRPPGARDPMEAVVGSGRPHTYLYASLLARELAEFGALWHGVHWGVHEVVQGLPEEPDWEWREQPPADWRPSVRREGDRVVVTFYTISPLGQEHIQRHVDTYEPATGYVPRIHTETIAVGPRYMVW